MVHNSKGSRIGDKTLLDQYVRNLFCQNDELEYGDFKHDMHIQLTPEEAKILELLIYMNGIKSIVEIGTFIGYSAIRMATVLQKRGEGVLHTIDCNAERAKIAQQNINSKSLSDIINTHLGDATEILNNTLNNVYDMVFIDADKGGYCQYLDWAEKHIRTGGLIVADNTLLFNNIVLSMDKLPRGVSKKSWEVMREFNLRLSDKKRYFSTLLPTKGGMTIAIKLF